MVKQRISQKSVQFGSFMDGFLFAHLRFASIVVNSNLKAITTSVLGLKSISVHPENPSWLRNHPSNNFQIRQVRPDPTKSGFQRLETGPIVPPSMNFARTIIRMMP
jgi:hypothetical protein